MYQVGEFVMYRNAGMCEVKAIGTLRFSENREREYYTLQPVHGAGNTCVYVPVNTDALRAVITKEEACRYLEELSQLPVPALSAKMRKSAQLAAYYKELLGDGGILGHLKLFKELCQKEQEVKGQRRKFGELDASYKNQVEQLLVDEFSYALGEDAETTRIHLNEAAIRAVQPR